MNPMIGLVGAFLLAFGGVIGFLGLNQVLGINSGRFDPLSSSFAYAGFVSFFLVGVGLWLIVQSGRADKSP
jgi:hypothetical protein